MTKHIRLQLATFDADGKLRDAIEVVRPQRQRADIERFLRRQADQVIATKGKSKLPPGWSQEILSCPVHPSASRPCKSLKRREGGRRAATPWRRT